MAIKLLGCELPSSCLREREGVEFQGPIVRSSVGKKGKIMKEFSNRDKEMLYCVLLETLPTSLHYQEELRCFWGELVKRGKRDRKDYKRPRPCGNSELRRGVHRNQQAHLARGSLVHGDERLLTNASRHLIICGSLPKFVWSFCWGT